MKAMKFAAFCLLGFLLSGIALFSVQNAAPVSIQFLLGRTIELPLGFVLSTGLGAGLCLSGLIPWLWSWSDR